MWAQLYAKDLLEYRWWSPLVIVQIWSCLYRLDLSRIRSCPFSVLSNTHCLFSNASPFFSSLTSVRLAYPLFLAWKRSCLLVRCLVVLGCWAHTRTAGSHLGDFWGTADDESGKLSAEYFAGCDIFEHSADGRPMSLSRSPQLPVLIIADAIKLSLSIHENQVLLARSKAHHIFIDNPLSYDSYCTQWFPLSKQGILPHPMRYLLTMPSSFLGAGFFLVSPELKLPLEWTVESRLALLFL